MTDIIQQYPLDESGKLLSNKIVNEQHVITLANNQDYKVIVPDAAPFFERSLKVRHKSGSTVNVLVRSKDYFLGGEFKTASREIGLPIFSCITFVNKAMQGVIEIEYQTLGGKFINNTQSIIKKIGELAYNPRFVTFEQIMDKPEAYPPTGHDHDVQEFIGYNDLVNSVHGIRDVLTKKYDPSNLFNLIVNMGILSSKHPMIKEYLEELKNATLLDKSKLNLYVDALGLLEFQKLIESKISVSSDDIKKIIPSKENINSMVVDSISSILTNYYKKTDVVTNSEQLEGKTLEQIYATLLERIKVPFSPEFEAINQRITNLLLTVNQLGNVSTFSEKLSKVENELKAMKNQVNVNKTDIAALKESINANVDNKIQEALKAIQEDIKLLKEKPSTGVSDADLNTINNSIKALSEKLDKSTEVIKQLEKNVDDINDELSKGLTNTIDSQYNAIEKILGKSERIYKDNKAEFKEYLDDKNALMERYEVLRARASSIKDENIRNSIDKLEKDKEKLNTLAQNYSNELSVAQSNLKKANDLLAKHKEDSAKGVEVNLSELYLLLELIQSTDGRLEDNNFGQDLFSGMQGSITQLEPVVKKEIENNLKDSISSRLDENRKRADKLGERIKDYIGLPIEKDIKKVKEHIDSLKADLKDMLEKGKDLNDEYFDKEISNIVKNLDSIEEDVNRFINKYTTVKESLKGNEDKFNLIKKSIPNDLTSKLKTQIDEIENLLLTANNVLSVYKVDEASNLNDIIKNKLNILENDVKSTIKDSIDYLKSVTQAKLDKFKENHKGDNLSSEGRSEVIRLQNEIDSLSKHDYDDVVSKTKEIEKAISKLENDEYIKNEAYRRKLKELDSLLHDVDEVESDEDYYVYKGNKLNHFNEVKTKLKESINELINKVKQKTDTNYQSDYQKIRNELDAYKSEFREDVRNYAILTDRLDGRIRNLNENAEKAKKLGMSGDELTNLTSLINEGLGKASKIKEILISELIDRDKIDNLIDEIDDIYYNVDRIVHEYSREVDKRKEKEEDDRKAEKERKEKEEAERLAREKAEAERKAKEEADRLAKLEAERKAKEEAERKAKEEAERKAKEKAEAERKAKEEADRLAKEKAEAERKAKEANAPITGEVKGKVYIDSLLGNNTNDGSSAKPYKTLDALLLNKVINENTNIYLKGGADRPEYVIGDNLVVNGNNTVLSFEAVDGERPVITGGYRIDSDGTYTSNRAIKLNDESGVVLSGVDVNLTPINNPLIKPEVSSVGNKETRIGQASLFFGRNRNLIILKDVNIVVKNPRNQNPANWITLITSVARVNVKAWGSGIELDKLGPLKDRRVFGDESKVEWNPGRTNKGDVKNDYILSKLVKFPRQMTFTV